VYRQFFELRYLAIIHKGKFSDISFLLSKMQTNIILAGFNSCFKFYYFERKMPILPLFVLIFYSQTCFFNEFCFQNIVNLLYLWIISCFLIIIFTYDLKHFIIPNQVIYPAIAIAFFYQWENGWVWGMSNLHF